MAILNREEYFDKLQQIVGSDTSDTAISFIEDMTDTFNSLENKANGDGTDWEQKYHELDESWKQKYAHRFFSGNGKSADVNKTDENVDDTVSAEEITIDDLFEENK